MESGIKQRSWLVARLNNGQNYLQLFVLLIATTLAASGAAPTTIIAWGNVGGYGTEIPEGLTNAISIVSSRAHTLALKPDGTVVGWGYPISGEAEALAAVTDAKAMSINDVGFNNQHGMLVRSNGTVVVWGSGSSGESIAPPGLTNVVSAAAGGHHSLVLKNDGTLVLWGANNAGQTDLPTGLTGVVAIAAGWDHNLALKSDGTVTAWGDNFFGESTVPAELSNVIAISTMWLHNLALRADGTVVAWGNNEYGQCNVPPGLSNVVAIVAGPWHSLAVKSDRTVVAWGKLANVLPGLSNVIAVSAGGDFSLALVEEAVPVILRHPQSQTVWASSEDGFGLRVEANGASPLSYQWLHDGVPLTGETNANLWVPSVQNAQSGEYTVVVSNRFGSVTSEPAMIVVQPFLKITAQSQSQTVQAGENVTFSVHAKGSDPFSYQWQRNQSDLLDETNSTLMLGSVQPSDSANYRVRVSNEAGSEDSASATLLVLTTNGPNIIAHPQSGAVFVGGRMVFSVTATGATTLTYQWRKDSSDLTGQNGTRLEFASVQAADGGAYDVVATDDFGSVTSAVATLTVTSHTFTFGTTGSVVSLGGPAVPAGLDDIVAISAGERHALALRSNGTVVEWANFPMLPGASESRVPAGLSNVVGVAAGEDQSLALLRDGTVVGWGGTAVPTELFGVTAIAAARGMNVALKADGSVTAWGSSASLNPPADLQGVIGIAAGSVFSITLKNDGSAGIWGLAGSINRNIFVSRTDLVAVAAGRTHVMGLKNDGTVLDYFGGSDPTNSAPAGLADVVSIAANSNSFALKADGSVVGWNGAALPAGVGHAKAIAAGDNFVLLLTTWPVITQQPKSLVLNEGQSALFNVAVAGTGPISFQWQKNGTNISGATDTNLTINSATSGDAGDYTVVVSNESGSVTSVVATLTINTAPVIVTQPQPQTVFATAKVAFSGSASGALPLSYQWQKDGVDLVGQTNSTLIINSTQPSDAGDYTLIVSNSYGSVTSLVAALAITSHTFSWPTPGTVVSLEGPMVPPGLTNAVAVAGGFNHSLALRSDGTVVEWGATPPPLPYTNARVPADLSNVVAIAAGGSRSLVLRADGTVVGWSFSATPAPSDLFGVIAIASGIGHSVALKADGTVTTWGVPAPVPAGLSNVVAVSASEFYSIALKNDGSAVIWGNSGQLNRNIFSGRTDLVAVSGGRRHVMGLRNDGTVLDYSEGSVPATTAPDDLSDVVAIAAGDTHSVALKSDGTVVRWNSAPTPEGISNVTAIAAGRAHSLLITADPPLPMLGVGLEAGQFTLKVPISVSGFILETATNLTQPFPPGGVVTNILTFGEAADAAASPATNTMMFFRLRREQQ